MNKFSTKAKEILKYYVYTLRDPRTGEVFYVGKGNEDRIFHHGKKLKEDKLKDKKIKEIMMSNHKVIREILHYGLEEKEALAAEASFINFFGKDNLTNIVSGHHTTQKYSVKEFEETFAAEKVKVTHNILVCKINNEWKPGMSENELYDITRGNWKASLEKAKSVDYVFGVYRGVVKSIYKALEWHKIGDKPHPMQPRIKEKYFDQGRIFFIKEESVPKHIIKQYKGKDVNEYVGNTQNPISYILNRK